MWAVRRFGDCVEGFSGGESSMIRWRAPAEQNFFGPDGRGSKTTNSSSRLSKRGNGLFRLFLCCLKTSTADQIVAFCISETAVPFKLRIASPTWRFGKWRYTNSAVFRTAIARSIVDSVGRLFGNPRRGVAPKTIASALFRRDPRNRWLSSRSFLGLLIYRR